MTRQKTTHELPRPVRFLREYKDTPKTYNSYSTALVHLNEFILAKYPNHNYDSMVDAILKDKVNVYEFLSDFVHFVKTAVSPVSVKLYVTAVKSYLEYYDVTIASSKFRKRVKLPRVLVEDEEPLELSEIRNILLGCSNKRLKTLLLILASAGTRAVETLALRRKDISFDVSPTRIHVRKEFNKTGRARDIYISSEATDELKKWLQYQDEWNVRNDYRIRKGVATPRTFTEDDLVFTDDQNTTPQMIYQKILVEFQKLLKTVNMDQRKESGVRRKITLHSFRRWVKTVLSTQVGQDYSEFYIGHTKSPYWTMKEPERRKIYADKCMKYLTYLDYSELDFRDASIEGKLTEKDKEIQLLKEQMEELKQRTPTPVEFKKLKDVSDLLLIRFGTDAFNELLKQENDDKNYDYKYAVPPKGDKMLMGKTRKDLSLSLELMRDPEKKKKSIDTVGQKKIKSK